MSGYKKSFLFLPSAHKRVMKIGLTGQPQDWTGQLAVPGLDWTVDNPRTGVDNWQYQDWIGQWTIPGLDWTVDNPRTGLDSPRTELDCTKTGLDSPNL